jgi:hypothetical protein
MPMSLGQTFPGSLGGVGHAGQFEQRRQQVSHVRSRYPRH